MSIEKSVTATARFRTVRLLVDDLREFERALAADEVSWRFGTREHLGTWSWKNVYTRSDSLDELCAAAPKGAVYQFEVQAQSGEQSFTLLLVGDDPRFVTLSYEGPGEQPSETFQNAVVPLSKAEKRGRKWHYIAAVIGPTIAFTVPLILLEEIGNVGWLKEQVGPRGDLAKATVWSLTSFFILALTTLMFWSWARLSSVTLRPIIDTSSIYERVVEQMKSVGRWAYSVPKADYMYKLIMLWSTVVAALCGFGAFVIAFFK
ncbi:hypothetical protein OWR29_39085 [Actinoplanes sp. Pm04-4]|uniref:Uncharacterized protein n=1 Tax=Paractinoplanes pyxinae TaxID=2997416 RepID=A0ABT4BBZ2_9ACTN|nr:hypothetical protein [Actinoplanes pyxinae]MCY1144036.1 hypothetical protein [Actinoplanes pyxinae]